MTPFLGQMETGVKGGRRVGAVSKRTLKKYFLNEDKVCLFANICNPLLSDGQEINCTAAVSLFPPVFDQGFFLRCHRLGWLSGAFIVGTFDAPLSVAGEAILMLAGCLSDGSVQNDPY